MLVGHVCMAEKGKPGLTIAHLQPNGRHEIDVVPFLSPISTSPHITHTKLFLTHLMSPEDVLRFDDELDEIDELFISTTSIIEGVEEATT